MEFQRMVRLFAIGTIAAVVLCTSTGIAFAKHNGNVCSAVASDVSIVDRDQYGVHNTSTSATATVYCPILKQTSGDEIGSVLRAMVYDRNSTSNVSCTFNILDNSGANVTGGSDTKSSSGSQSSYQNLDFSGITASTSGNMVVVCTIPPVQSGSFSHVAEFHWITP